MPNTAVPKNLRVRHRRWNASLLTPVPAILLVMAIIASMSAFSGRDGSAQRAAPPGAAATPVPLRCESQFWFRSESRPAPLRKGQEYTVGNGDKDITVKNLAITDGVIQTGLLSSLTNKGILRSHKTTATFWGPLIGWQYRVDTDADIEIYEGKELVAVISFTINGRYHKADSLLPGRWQLVVHKPRPYLEGLALGPGDAEFAIPKRDPKDGHLEFSGIMHGFCVK